MSAEDVRKHMTLVSKMMFSDRSYSYDIYRNRKEIRPNSLATVNSLLVSYGTFIGNAKAKHMSYSEEINRIDEQVNKYFELMTKSGNVDYCFKIINLGMNKISEQLSYIESLDNLPADKKISKKVYDKLVHEKDSLEKVAQYLVKYKGLPELNILLETSINIGMPTDEHWVLALCAVNLIESIVNKKLESIESDTKGNFKSRYKRLVKLIKEKENRDVSELLPLAIYDGIRNKLDHASHTNRVTPKEANQISDIVIELITELFS